MQIHRALIVSLSLLFAFDAGAQPGDPPAIAPISGPWNAEPGFDFAKKAKKTRRSLSGIACPANPSGRLLCLAVFDEGGEARYLTLGKDSFAVDGERVVLHSGKIELDAEAAATDGTFYYVTGSHSAKRSGCASNPDSRHVFRFKVDPATGRALREPAGAPVGKLYGFADSGALWTLMAGIPGLKEHVGEEMCLGSEPSKGKPGRRGVNIEGLAVKDGRLFFGFRGPARDGTAGVLSVEAGALFDGSDPKPLLTTLELGKGRAVRDMLAVSDGILILAGPDDDKANAEAGWIVARWDGVSPASGTVRPRGLASLDLSGVRLRGCDEELKPEAVAVTEDLAGAPYRAVIFSDGLCDGGPLSFTLPR